MSDLSSLPDTALLRILDYLPEDAEAWSVPPFSLLSPRWIAAHRLARTRLLLSRHYGVSISDLLEYRDLLIQLNLLHHQHHQQHRCPHASPGALDRRGDYRHMYIYDEPSVAFEKRLDRTETLLKSVRLSHCLRHRPSRKDLVGHGLWPDYALRMATALVRRVWEMEHRGEHEARLASKSESSLVDLQPLMDFWRSFGSGAAALTLEDRQRRDQMLGSGGTIIRERIARFESLQGQSLHHSNTVNKQ